MLCGPQEAGSQAGHESHGDVERAEARGDVPHLLHVTVAWLSSRGGCGPGEGGALGTGGQTDHRQRWVDAGGEEEGQAALTVSASSLLKVRRGAPVRVPWLPEKAPQSAESRRAAWRPRV